MNKIIIFLKKITREKNKKKKFNKNHKLLQIRLYILRFIYIYI